MQLWKFHPGDKLWAASDALENSYSAVFEDDGETGYFYAYDCKDDPRILDAVFIYNVKDVSDRKLSSELMICWSVTQNQCALVINGYPHAAFDFKIKRGYCRTNFPNFENTPEGKWPQHDHSWSDEPASWLKDVSHD